MDFLINLKKQRKERFYTIEELEKLNTKRLLAFYKKERKRFYRFEGGKFCECCGELHSNLYPDDKYYTEEFPKIEAEWREYLKEIKSMLDTRKHVEN